MNPSSARDACDASLNRDEATGQDRFDGGLDLDAAGYPVFHGVVS
jgi:hypothetical protein